jgi:DNA repair protein RadC
MKKPFKRIAKSDCYQVCNQVTEAQIMATAMEIVARRFKRGNSLSAPSETMAYLSVQHAGLEHELFSVMFMDNRNRVISYDPMFNGTIDGASVYPREVVKRALACNAAAVILTHNHPSGVAEPSQADIQITERIKKALALVDIRVLDHIILAGMENVSFAERGLI